MLRSSFMLHSHLRVRGARTFAVLGRARAAVPDIDPIRFRRWPEADAIMSLGRGYRKADRARSVASLLGLVEGEDRDGTKWRWAIHGIVSPGRRKLPRGVRRSMPRQPHRSGNRRAFRSDRLPGLTRAELLVRNREVGRRGI